MAFGSLDTIIKIVDFLNVPFIEINSGLCSDIRKKGSCSHCKDICPTNAIEIGREITIDPKKCVRCGSCATICHNGVFTLLDGSDETVLANIDQINSSRDTITIQCNGCNNAFKVKHKKIKKDEGKLVVPCLGRINEIVLLRLRELDFKNVTFSECNPKCPFKSAWNGFYETLILSDHLRKTITETYRDPQAFPTPKNRQTKNSNAQNRRDFVQLAGKRAAALALDIDPSKKQMTRLAQHLPVRRRILMDFLNSYQINDHIVEKGALPFAEIEIMSSCDICGACCFICPSGALTLKENSPKTSIVFEVAKCIGCELCVKICDKGYLHMKDEVNLGSLNGVPIILHELPNRKCSKCEMSFVSVSDSALCPQCKKRENLKNMISGKLV
jgi:ferredoxin